MLCALVDFVHPPVHWDSITAHTWRQNHDWQPNGAQWNLPNQQTLSSNCNKNTSNKLGHHTILLKAAKAYYNTWGVLGDPTLLGYPQNNYSTLIIGEELYALGFLPSPIFEGRSSCLGRRLIDTDSPKNDSNSTCSILPGTTDFAKNSMPWLVCEHL